MQAAASCESRAYAFYRQLMQFPHILLLEAIKVPCFFLILSMYRGDASGGREGVIIRRGGGCFFLIALHCMGTLKEELCLFGGTAARLAPTVLKIRAREIWL